MPGSTLLLGIDTCGPEGSVALARQRDGRLELLDQRELAGRTYSANLVGAVAALLSSHGHTLGSLAALVVVAGPGSFTGVRVGLSAAKGLVQPSGIPLIAVSRLAVLAHKAGTTAAALDAHRHEIFLRFQEHGSEPREQLAGAAELAGLPSPVQIALCDAAEDLVLSAWPAVRPTRTEPPTAWDALSCARPRLISQAFDDWTTLDGHYLRRSDAEIFGDPGPGSNPTPRPQ
jgi:tRNA threonylcarbamoyladenosine biosynthesis protein TsaB